ncbi:hypothetical protein Tco_1203222 [Tanacetum coccineum]
MSSQEQPSQVPITEPITDSFTTSHPTQTPSPIPNEPPLGEGNTSRSGEGSMQLLELTELCTKLSDKGRMTEIEYEGFTLQQFTPTKVTQGEEQCQESSEAQLSVLSTTKILADASKEKVLFSTAEEVQGKGQISADKKEMARATAREEHEMIDIEKALKLQKHLDEREENDNIDFNTVTEQVQERQSDTIKRYQTLKKKPYKKLKDKDKEELQKRHYFKESFKNWEIHTEGSRKYWKIIRVGNIIEAYQVLEDMLKGFDKEYLVTLWNLVKERFRSAKPTKDKERALWVELKRLFEPDKDDIIMVNVIPPDHVDDVLVVKPNQHNDVPVVPELVLVNEDKDPKEDEFEEEEDPQEEEDDMEVDIKEDENERELTYPYEEVDPLNPLPPASESEPEDAIKVENPIEHEDDTIHASIHEVGESSTAPFLCEDSDGLLPGLMRRDINSLFDNEVRSSVDQGTAAMEKLVEKLGNVEDKVKCKKLKKELEEARGFLFDERPNEAINVLIEDEKSPSSELRGSPHDA